MKYTLATRKLLRPYIQQSDGRPTSRSGLPTGQEVRLLFFSIPSILGCCSPTGFLLSQTAPYSIVSTPEHDVHRRRRNGLNSFFSVARVRRLESILHENIAKMLHRLEQAGESVVSVQIQRVFKACASDVITAYALNDSFHFLDMEDYGQVWFESTDIFFFLTHVFAVFPWLVRLVQSAPSWVVERLFPPLKFLRFRQDVSSPARREKAYKNSLKLIRAYKRIVVA
jgi:hypothetical protein